MDQSIFTVWKHGETILHIDLEVDKKDRTAKLVQWGGTYAREEGERRRLR
jgi:hypothetical protein